MKNLEYLLLGLAAIFLLVACQQSSPPEVGNPIPPTQNQISFTATLTREPTLAPSPTLTSTPTNQPTATVTRAAPTPTASLVPTILPSPTVEAGQPLTLTTLFMADESVGWAIEAPSHIVRTMDGGLTWSDVTPANLTADIIGGFFLNAQSAWVYDYYDLCKGLAHSTDGGKTWSILTNYIPFTTKFSISITFLNEEDGWAENYDVGAGQGYITLYGTHDSGATWSQIMLSSPGGPFIEFPGTLGVCNICGDSFYYDPARMIITYGDLASDAVGEVHLSVSMDLGKTWKDLHLPMPSTKYSDGLVAPQLPIFYTDKDGYLPVGIIRFNPDGSHAYDVLAVYTTHDGGLSWNSNPTVLENVQNMIMGHHVVDFVSPMDAFVACGNNLCVTHDGAQTWQKNPSSLNFSYAEGKTYVEWFDFVSPTAGWAITSDDSKTTLWRTTDSGVTWQEITPRLLP